MNATSVRPHTKLAAALVAAGVVSAASVVGVPEDRGLPAINTDVANASVITDALYGLGDAVNGVASGAALTLDGAFSLPFDVFSAIAIATQNSSLAPNLMSWLVQRYTNPSDLYPNYSYPFEIKYYSIEPLAGLLPSAIGSSIIAAVNQIADAINDGLSGLPDPDVGEFATTAFWDTDIGRVVKSANYALTAPVWMLYETAFYLGYLPADLEETVESAIQNPSEIPGLVSELAHELLSPSYGGLLPSLIYYASLPLTNLPGPIGELSTDVVNAAYDGLDNLLSLLPAPISPTPFLSASQSAEFADTSADANSLPEASLAVPSTEPVEKNAEATDSAPAADTDAPAAGADTMVTGNKVEPGDTFGSQVAGETVKDDDAAVSTPGVDEVAAGDPAEGISAQDTETDGAGDPAPADSDAAA